MCENNGTMLPSVIKSASDAIQKNIPETAQQADGVLSTVVGFFNNVVLYPVKKANLTFRYKLEAFEDDLKEKIKNIPDEHLQVPSTMIAGPTLEALRYTYDETELREMYENLLASAMDDRTAAEAHPAFVDAIKQMTPLEARILEIIAQKRQLKCGGIKFCIVGTTNVYSKAMPDHFVEELTELGEPFLISAAITNLERLGFINVTLMGLTGQDYQKFEQHPYVLEREKLFKSFGREFRIEVNEHALVLNNYGQQFARICLSMEV